MGNWNIEIIDYKKFPSKLKYADLAPIFKKLECALKEKYRPVSIPAICVTDEGIYREVFLCGYRKGYNTRYALTTMIEKWKKHLDNNGIAGAFFMDLSKVFDTLNRELLIAKL